MSFWRKNTFFRKSVKHAKIEIGLRKNISAYFIDIMTITILKL